jgi:hypothetical protein
MMLSQIRIYEKEWGMEGTEVCYRIIYLYIKAEVDKRKSIDIKNDIIKKLGEH